MLRAQTPPALTTLIVLTAFSTLSLNMFLPSLANIAADLNADYGTVNLAVAGYLAVTAVVQLIAGPVSDRVGRRPVLIGCIALFVTASALCAMSTNVVAFLVFRMLQAGVVTGYALSLAIVRDTTPQRQAAGLIGYISMAMAIAPMLGPMIGGVMDTLLGWRAIFWFYAIGGTGLILLCWVDLGETRPTAPSGRMGYVDGVRDLLKAPLFWAYSMCGAFSTGAFYIFLTGASLVAKNQFGVSTAQLGFFVGSITSGFMLGGFLSGRWAPHVRPTSMMLAGRLIACTGLTAGILILGLGITSPLFFFGSTIFVGLGNGITMPSTNAAALSVRPGATGSAAGVNGALNVSSGAVLTFITGAVLPDHDPGMTLLVLMLGSSVCALIAVLLAIWLNRGLGRRVEV